MANVPHPSLFVNKDDVHIIRSTAAEAEKMGMLHPDQLAIIYNQSWFKLLVPKIYGGQQLTLPELVRLQEVISWLDGSTGWVVTLCSGAGWFGGFLAADIAEKVFNDPKVCLAGSGAPTGTATITPNGYLINGTWRYVSGAHHATHITANCLIEKDGIPLMDDGGEQLILPFIFDKMDVTLLPAWKYIGMVATGSDMFEIKDLEVPANRQFKIDPSAAVIDAPLYQYPFLQLAEATLAVNISGIAIHFMDLCSAVFDDKIKQPRITKMQGEFLLNEFSETKAALDKTRNDFFEAVDNSWKTTNDNTLTAVSTISRQLAKLARESVDRLYPYCGLMAAATDTEINRAWRDLHTASQHSLLTFAV